MCPTDMLPVLLYFGLLFGGWYVVQSNYIDPVKWLKSYLDQRHQRVVLEGSYSDFLKINAGVPQGLILGPLLFLLFINDIVTEIGSNIKLFADDTSLYLIVEDPVTAADLMDTDLDKIHTWAETWLVKFKSS